MAKKLTKEQIEADVINHIQQHITKHEDGEFFVTDKHSINMRVMWDTVRKNFYGLFDKSEDRFGAQKIFYPITEFMVWENMKNIDVDTKDINMRARHPKNIAEVEAQRYIVKDWMLQNQFGEQLNEWLTPFVLDGHLIVKKIFALNPNTKKKNLKVVQVDIRNTFFDMQGKGIQKSDFVERFVQDKASFKNTFSKVYINLDKIQDRFDVAALYDEDKEVKSQTPQVEGFEFWGQLPEKYITGDPKDTDWVDCHAVMTNASENAQLHKLEKNKDKYGIKPYEEVKFEDAPGRAVGRGIGEKVIYLQTYLNSIYNTRRLNNSLSANQLFEVRKDSGVNPSSVRDLISGGVVSVSEVGRDIGRIDTQDYDFSQSLSEEENLVRIAQRQTQTQEPASGEQLPASMPATNAVIQNQAVRSSFAQRQEVFGLFLSRLFQRQLLPDIMKLYSKGDLLRLTDDSDKIRAIQEKASEFFALREAEDLIEKGEYPSMEQLTQMKEQAFEKIENQKDLYVEIDGLNQPDADVEFFVTGESVDKNGLIQSLQQILFNYSGFAQDPNAQKILRELYDILGLDSKQLMPDKADPAVQALAVGGTVPEGQPGQAPIAGANLPQPPSEGTLLNRNVG